MKNRKIIYMESALIAKTSTVIWRSVAYISSLLQDLLHDNVDT